MQALKERVIAIEVFGRQPESELGEDTIVRVGAREVRKRLAQYYVSPEGSASEIRIDLAPGAYAAEFRAVSGVSVETVVVPAPKARAAHGWRLRLVVLAGAVAALGAGLVAMKSMTPSPAQRAFGNFWQPVMQSPGPLLVAVAHPLVYHPSLRALKLNEAKHPEFPLSEQRPIELPPKEIDGSDLVPVFDQYVGFGDMAATADVARLLARHDKDVRLRLASGVQFADLRQAPTLLIGAITNRWTMELQQSWRFQFSRTPEFVNLIVDTAARGPSQRQWTIPSAQDGSSPEDYMLISRVQSSYTGGLVLVAAGLKQFGTEAAGALLTDPERLGAILRQLPAGWETKNLQIVLHSKIIGNTATQPELVAWHVWMPANSSSKK